MLKRCCYCLLFLFLALGMGAGCAPYWYRSPEKFTVKNSRLNWVQIFYQASEDAPRVRCDMTNNGQIAILEVANRPNKGSAPFASTPTACVLKCLI